MNAATIAKSARLQRALAALTEAGPAGLTTMGLVEKARVCAVNSIVAELRANGVLVDCQRETIDGAPVFRYRLGVYAPAEAQPAA